LHQIIADCKFIIMQFTIIGLLLLLLLMTTYCNNLHQPLESFANGEECALILEARGRTNIYDYTYNLLRGSL